MKESEHWKKWVPQMELAKAFLKKWIAKESKEHPDRPAVIAIGWLLQGGGENAYFVHEAIKEIEKRKEQNPTDSELKRAHLNLKAEHEKLLAEYKELERQRDLLHDHKFIHQEQHQVYELALALVHAEAPSYAMIFQQKIDEAFKKVNPKFFKMGIAQQ